jgi:adenylosuccinate synthase
MATLADLSPQPARWSPWGLRIALSADAKNPAIHAEPAFIKGAVEVQDEGSQLAALMAGAKPGELSEILPVGAEELERCEPVYEELPGWKESTVGIKAYEKLPKGARDYLRRIESLAGVPVDLISTGPDRDETIVRRHPFQ